MFMHNINNIMFSFFCSYDLYSFSHGRKDDKTAGKAKSLLQHLIISVLGLALVTKIRFFIPPQL